MVFCFPRAARGTQARGRLRTAVLRVDEVALEMRGQDTRAARRRRARKPDLVEHAAKRIGTAGDRGGAERGDAVARQPSGDRLYGITDGERVDALDAVHVHVDESGHDVVMVKRESRMCAVDAAGANFDDASLVYDQRAGR
jgi:hypothetical protein